MEEDPPGGAFMLQQLTAIKDIVEDTLRPILSAMEHGHGGPLRLTRHLWHYHDCRGSRDRAPLQGLATPQGPAGPVLPQVSWRCPFLAYGKTPFRHNLGMGATCGISTQLVVPSSPLRGGEAPCSTHHFPF